MAQGTKLNKQLYPYKRPSMRVIGTRPNFQEEINFISQDLARKLIVPDEGPKQVKALITEEKLEKLRKAAEVKLKDEEKDKKRERAKLQEKLYKEQEARKAEFEAWDLIRKKNEKLTELEEEAKQKMEYLREKADEAIREQNQEIREINQLLLSAQVQTIRDSQVEEKKLIKKEHALAEANLDAMMENERRKGVLKEREMEKKRKEACFESNKKLQEQIKSNKEQRLIEEEKKIKEGEILLQKMKENQMRDYQDMKLEKLKKQTLREELIRDNEEIMKRKQLMKEQSEKEDLIIAEYQRLKAAQEEAKEAEEKEMRRLRELELSRMAELRERFSDVQVEQVKYPSQLAKFIEY